MSSVVQTFPLDFQWQTVDPFLFCVHHDDVYPPGDESLAPPAEALEGRQIGNDFELRDGWRMYHGSKVPGFPAHPHRGFETVTFARRGIIDHADSLGAAARFGRGDVQWITTGAGIVHSEMFPLLDSDGPNHTELFQIWLNLPAANKMVEPHFKMLWAPDIPTVETGDGVTVTVIAGPIGDQSPPSPPPSSWAADPANDVVIWHVVFDAGAAWTLPEPRSAESIKVAYLFEGGPIEIDGTTVDPSHGAALEPGTTPTITNVSDGPVEILILGGRPIGEPVAQYGPFVLNDRAGIQQAFRDYQQTGFGGWPWPADDPDHGPDRPRFARHADGTETERDPTEVDA